MGQALKTAQKPDASINRALPHASCGPHIASLAASLPELRGRGAVRVSLGAAAQGLTSHLPPAAQVTFMLLDQNNREHAIDAFRPDLSSASFQRPQSETNVASGCPLFFPLNRLQSPRHAYVKDDTMFLKCIVETST